MADLKMKKCVHNVNSYCPVGCSMRVPEAGPCPGFEVKTTVENQTDIGSQCWAGPGVPMPGGSGEQKFVEIKRQ